MSGIYLERRLWYLGPRGVVTVDQSFLEHDPRALIVLAEAGMGKSTLLDQFTSKSGYAVCTARRLINQPDPSGLLGSAHTLVIDGLDEVSAPREGDAVDQVVRRLAGLGSPRFILSCRVADWRSATALQGLSDFYPEILELHLEPLSRDAAVRFLAANLGLARAESTIEHFEARGLAGLCSNPQTLELIARVAEQGPLPTSKGELFDTAIRLLRAEHRKEKAGSALARLPEATVLDALGAGFAALVLTGKEAIERNVDADEADLPLNEISALPGANSIDAALDARLVEARGGDRFTYSHRAIGEFLGARWLADRADTPRKRRRLLTLFNNQALVPASLRGIHAWLAWHAPPLTEAILRADPMGVIEYGDADRLSPAEGEALLDALFELSKQNPRFREWTDYRAGGLVQPALLPRIRAILSDHQVEFSLRALVLQVLKGSSLIAELQEALHALVSSEAEYFAIRSEAADRLVEAKLPIDWPSLVQALVDENSEDSLRLSSELMPTLGYEWFSDALVLTVVKAQVAQAGRYASVFFRLERSFPVERLKGLLDGLADLARDLGDRHTRPGNHAITDLQQALLVRQLSAALPSVERLWAWMEPFEAQYSYNRTTQETLAGIFRGNDSLRRALQIYVLLALDDDAHGAMWRRAWRMREATYGLQPSQADLLNLMDHLPEGDPRWREVVELSRISLDGYEQVKHAAHGRAQGDADAEAWLEQFFNPPVPDWQIEQEAQDKARTARREADWARHRQEFAAHIEEMRSGVYRYVVNPAKAYLKLFQDMGDEMTIAPSRIEEWLGAELRVAALQGFEAFLTAQPPKPSAAEIAASHAEGRRWEASFILIAALAERLRTGRGFGDLPDERLLAGYLEIAHTQIDDHAGLGGADGLGQALESALRQRGQWEIAQRQLFEPQLGAGLQHVSGLYPFVRSDRDDALIDRLAVEWLERLPDMSHAAEIELIDRLLGSEAGRLALRGRLPKLMEARVEDAKVRAWTAVALLLDFSDARVAQVVEHGADPKLLWELRARLSGQRETGTGRPLSIEQLVWMIGTFRRSFPYSPRPVGPSSGDTNPSDASDFLISLINRLGDMVSSAATTALAELRDARPADGYTDPLRVAAAEQRRKRVEANWVAPNLGGVAAVVEDRAPTTSAQLQAVMLEELATIQAKIGGSNVDWYRDFFVDGTPRNEEDCRDVLIKMMGDPPFGIQVEPEAHLADDKRCDILCMAGEVVVPIELKGQWHKDLWTAADRQLDLLYVQDWRAERGIYVVLWFGQTAAKTLAKPPADIPVPQTAEALRAALTERSATTREGRTAVVVLDLTRPA